MVYKASTQTIDVNVDTAQIVIKIVGTRSVVPKFSSRFILNKIYVCKRIRWYLLFEAIVFYLKVTLLDIILITYS